MHLPLLARVDSELDMGHMWAQPGLDVIRG